MATKTSKREDGLLNYKPDSDLDSIARATDYLVWASSHFPRRPVPITHIVKFALLEPKIPNENSKDVLSFKESKLRRIRALLMRKYHRGLVYHPGIGYRTTVDDDDIVENVMEKRRKRVESSIASLTEAESIVNSEHIKSERVKSRFDDLSEASRRLNAPGIRDRLAPPAEPEKDK